MAEVAIGRDNAVSIVTMTPSDGFMTESTVAALDAATAEIVDDAEVRAVVLTGGNEGIFIRHYSVEELARISNGLRARGIVFSEERPAPERQIDRLFDRLIEADKPVLAAINGTAMGGGFELALACDIRIALAGPYDLGLPEANLGILPGAGGTQRLARLLGPARALEMVLRGRTVNPDEALALGMVHEVVTGDVVAHAVSLGQEIARQSPLAVAHIKRLIRRESARSVAETLPLERTLFLDLLVSDEAAELIAAMNEGEIDIRHGRTS